MLAVCDLLSAGAVMVASLTSCSEALHIDSLLAGLSVPHAVLPYPICFETAAKLLAPTSILVQTNASAIAAATAAVLRKLRAEKMVLLTEIGSSKEFENFLFSFICFSYWIGSEFDYWYLQNSSIHRGITVVGNYSGLIRPIGLMHHFYRFFQLHSYMLELMFRRRYEIWCFC